MNETLEPNSQSSTRILLVEDNAVSRQLMGDYLEYHGYKVLKLAKGEPFASAMRQFSPHLVLLDLKLPDIDGYSLLQQRQWNSDWMKVPVIVISAFAFQADQQRALKLGACQYLVKPVSLTQLREVIDQELSYPLVS
jgi:two-component system, cell cycle response regulator DivK